jgi:hypothetical protein
MEAPMSCKWSAVAASGLMILAGTGGMDAALAQKSGGVLKMFNPDTPASMSIHEESTAFSQRPMMAVFNNLVMYDQTSNRTVSSRSSRIWRLPGHGTRWGQS